eukprot:TRINITY_DN7264_c0_g1_i1.p1 TRINITY_DN7264_c0_g1~~TRINITY_DN7264_c0_g1_i1.p1  ORF type:complete len:142 (-),score=46.07 TRINITY_DN7264_c0_g1_i1:11-436(-)
MESSTTAKPAPTDFQQSVILRLVKEHLPDNISVGKDAKSSLTKAAKLFVQYLTAAANDYCQSCNRTLLSSNHVFGALDELELGHYKEKLQKALDEYKATQAKKADKKKDDAKKPEDGKEENEEEVEDIMDEDDEDVPEEAK